MATLPLTITQWLQIPQAQRPPFQDPVLQAIQAFTQSFPLDPPHLPDGQIHHPNFHTGAYGTTILPLWETTPTINPSSPHWQLFNTFLETLAIAMFEAAKQLRVLMPTEFNQAMTIYNSRRSLLGPQQTIAPRIGFNCFESVRINANITLAHGPLTTSHPSKMAAVMAFGTFDHEEGGNLINTSYGIKFPLKPGTISLCRTTDSYTSTLVTGERYQLEFFLPDLATASGEQSSGGGVGGTTA